MSMALADMERRLANMVRIGTIDQLDEAGRRLRVQAGGNRTAWLPWPAEIGRNFRRWRPLRQGQQVVLLAPSGDLAQAVIVGMLYSADVPAPDDSPDVDLILFDDGTRLEYDSGAHTLTAEIKGSAVIKTDAALTATVGTDAMVTAGGSISATAASQISLAAPNISLTGAVTIAGPLSAVPGAAGGGATLQGGMEITGGDVTADGYSLKLHRHGGVETGSGTSGPATP